MTTNQHITERHFDLLAAFSEQLTEQERVQIEAHLSRCKLCAEQWQAVQGFYNELHTKLDEPPSSQDEQLAEELLRPSARKLLPSDALIETYVEVIKQRPFTLPQRFIRYFQLHPARSVGYATALTAALVVGMLLLKPVRDLNPAYATIKNQTLHVLNKSHEVLWTKGAEGMRDWPLQQEDFWPFGPEYYFRQDNLSSSTPVRVFDIDGDGIREVLVSAGPTMGYSPSFAGDSLYCFEADGRLRWVYSPRREAIRFGAVVFSDPTSWYVQRFVPIRRTPDAKVQFFVIAHHRPSWPSRVSELDPPTGKELQTYWHTGAINLTVVADIDGDGANELIFGGINNGFNRACILVMDPRTVSGIGPTSPELKPQHLPTGTEKHYVLLPRADMLESDDPYNMIWQMTVADQEGVVVQTNEGRRSSWLNQEWFYGLVYSFDGSWQLTSLVASSPFEKTLERAKREGLLADSKLDEAFYNRLRDGIRYWDGERFVREPVMNRRYRELVMR